MNLIQSTKEESEVFKNTDFKAHRWVAERTPSWMNRFHRVGRRRSRITRRRCILHEALLSGIKQLWDRVLINNMLKSFFRYFSVGVINTIIHWFSFWMLIDLFFLNQAIANFLAFFIAVTFSFFANAKWTFMARATSGRYLLFLLFMGFMAAFFGHVSDAIGAGPVIMLISFSMFSLLIGYAFSKFIIFRRAK